MDCRNRLWRILLLVFSCLATVVGCAAQQNQTYIFMVFSNPVAGQEAAYNHWYDNQHAQDVVAVPDFQEAQRFVRSEIQLRVSAPLPDYLIIYKIVTADLPAVFAEVNRRLDTRMTIIDSSFDKSSSISFTYKVMGPVIYPDRRAGGARPAPSPASAREALPLYDQLVFADPTAGQEMEFNQWYDHQHAPEVVSAPGFVSAQRYVLSEAQYNRRKKPTKYFAIYQIRSADLAADFAEYKRLAPAMKTSPAFGENYGYTYKAIGPVIYGDAVRAQRARAGTGTRP
jgi:hypothetical protein